MKYEVGQKVKIKSLDWYNENKDELGVVLIENGNYMFCKSDTEWCGKIVTIKEVCLDEYYTIVEDFGKYRWTDEMIEGIVEEPILSAPKITEGLFLKEKDMKWTTEYILPEGYIFKDENGNVINATKIVLEKKKIVNLTLEQIYTMIHDSCVLFCKHCRCGIPRETCISLGTCKDHDEYRAAIRAHLMEKYKD